MVQGLQWTRHSRSEVSLGLSSGSGTLGLGMGVRPLVRVLGLSTEVPELSFRPQVRSEGLDLT